MYREIGEARSMVDGIPLPFWSWEVNHSGSNFFLRWRSAGGTYSWWGDRDELRVREEDRNDGEMVEADQGKGFSLRSLFAASILRTPNSNRSDSDLRFPSRDRNQYMSLKHVQYCSPFQLELPLGCASRQKTLLQNKNAKRIRTHLKKSPALVLTKSVWKI